MGNSAWIIVLIAVVVWIVIHLVRGQQSETTEDQPDDLSRGESPGRTRQPPREVNRFLEEINRRRREAERPRVSPAARREETQPSPRRVQPARPEQLPRPVAAAMPVARRLPSESARSIPAVLEVIEEAPARLARAPGRVPEAAVVSPVLSVETLSAIEQKSPAAVLKKKAPAFTSIAPFLCAPQSLRTLVVLQEVFGPPRCRRRRG